MRGFTERPSESKRLVLTSLPHQLQPAVWLGRNPHRRLFKATKHKLGVSEVVQGRKCKAPAFPVGVAPADWLFRVPCGWRCHSEFHSKRHTCHSPDCTRSCGGGGARMEFGWKSHCRVQSPVRTSTPDSVSWSLVPNSTRPSH